MAIFLLSLLSLLTPIVQGFLAPSYSTYIDFCPLRNQPQPTAGSHTYPLRVFGSNSERFNSVLVGRLGSPAQQAVVGSGDAPPLMALNGSLVDSTILAGGNKTAGTYQITRPRWYSKTEAAIIVLLVKKLRLLDVRGVENMLETTEAFRKEDPIDISTRAIFLSKVAPGTNFRTVIQRHPRTLLVPVHTMDQVCQIISDAYPGANMARVIERIPSMFSRSISKLERNIAGLKKYAPEVDAAIFQAAPSMLFIPPKTIERKVVQLRRNLPGMNLHMFLKGMPTVLARSDTTVPRGMAELKKRFPKSTNRQLVKIVESAPALVRMSGANGTLDIKVDALMALLPGVNMTNIFSNAPGVLIRSTGSLPSKVDKLEELFPSANVTKMVSRTPGILYLDIDRTVRPKALWIQQAVGLDQEGLNQLIEQGPWLLKAGWGPLARLEFAIETGIARKDRPAGLVGLVRRSRVAFAEAHHPAYAKFLQRRLDEEGIDENEGEDFAKHSKAWVSGILRPSDDREKLSASTKKGAKVTKTLKNAGVIEAGAAVDSNERGGVGVEDAEDELVDDTAVEVGQLEDRLGRGRKSRMSGMKDPPAVGGQRNLARASGSPHHGDVLLDLGKGTIVRRDPPQLGP